MKRLLIILGMLTMVLVNGLCGCVGPVVTDEFNGEYTINPYTFLSVTNLNGGIDIIGWDGDKVTVNAVKKSTYGTETLNRVNISVSQTENHLEIVTKYPDQKFVQAEVDYTIKVPYNVTIETVTTTNGAIDINNGSGDLLASTSNGAITLTDIEGIVSATTSNGHIEIRRTTGVSDVRTSNAAITAEVYSFQDDIRIETSNAAISLYLNPQLNATVDMITSNSKIHLQGIALNVSLLEDTHVIGTLGENGKRIDVHTSNANIYIYNLE
jgi:DUF4097 and DUF4098 domain-containing protein YvlB